MLSDLMLSALNAQITQEKFASATYCQMASWFAAQNLQGFCKYFQEQSKEELSHAQKFINYIWLQMGEVKLSDLSAPKQSWYNPIEVAKDALELEKNVTLLINDLMKFALSESDFATQSMLLWFIDEQVKSEFEANELLQKLIMIGDDKAALLAIDEDLEPTPNTGDFWNIKSDDNV